MLTMQEVLPSQTAALAAPQPCQQTALQANAKVSFVTSNITIAGTECTSSERYFPDFQSAEKQARLSQYNRIGCRLHVAGKNFCGILKNYIDISAAITKTITKLTLLTEYLSSARHLANSYPNITHIHLQNPYIESFSELHLFKHLSSLVIDDTSRKDAGKRFSQLSKIENLSDQILEPLQKCPKLTKLTLINVETVSTAAILSLRQKMPQLNVHLDFHSSPVPAPVHPQPFEDADICFASTLETFKDGCFSSFTKTTRCYEPLNRAPDTVTGWLNARIRTAFSSYYVAAITTLPKRAIDTKQIRSCSIDRDGPFGTVSTTLKLMKDAPNLQDLFICNIKKLSLEQIIKELPQHVQTITINNSQLKKSDEKVLSLGFKVDQIIDDASLFELLKLPSLKKISLIDCDGIKDPMIDYANTTKKGALTVERLRLLELPKEPEKMDGKEEKKEATASANESQSSHGQKRKAEDGAENSAGSGSNPQAAKRAKTDAIELD